MNRYQLIFLFLLILNIALIVAAVVHQANLIKQKRRLSDTPVTKISPWWYAVIPCIVVTLIIVGYDPKHVAELFSALRVSSKSGGRHGGVCVGETGKVPVPRINPFMRGEISKHMASKASAFPENIKALVQKRAEEQHIPIAVAAEEFVKATCKEGLAAQGYKKPVKTSTVAFDEEMIEQYIPEQKKIETYVNQNNELVQVERTSGGKERKYTIVTYDIGKDRGNLNQHQNTGRWTSQGRKESTGRKK